MMKGVLRKQIQTSVALSSERFSGLRNFDAFQIRSFRPCAGTSNFLIANRLGNVSLVGAISRGFALPLVSGPLLQARAYHIDPTLADSCNSYVPEVLGNETIDVSVSKSSILGLPESRLTLHGHGSVAKSRSHTSLPLCRYLVDTFGKSFIRFREMESGWKRTSTAFFSAATAPDLSYKVCSHNSMNDNDDIPSEHDPSLGNDLTLVSGSCYLPHPDKEETGGEDAHFICENKQAIGVADGVGGWADLGINAGYYSRELMSNSVNAIEEEPRGAIDPARVLEKAHSITTAKGSSTACIIALTNKGLNAINLGDSGFMVIREGCTIFRSPTQQHNFNYTYQLESGGNGDLPSSGLVFTINVAPGDVIVAGTDGLFDNLYNNEITAVVVHAVRAGLSPLVAAQKIAALAKQRAEDKDRQTPFSAAAQDAGFRYYGGKLDDITVVVSFVANSNGEYRTVYSR